MNEKKPMKIIEGANEHGRLDKLKQLLADELKSDKPSPAYVADLTLSIKHLQRI